MKRVVFYFDGFNFYHGLKDMSKIAPEWRQYYWIDFVAFCKQFLPGGQELSKVKYFTAPPLNSGKRSRQAALLSANELLNPNVFQVIRGKYYNKNITCKICHGVFQQPEEKRTDVNISIHLLMDCFQNNVDKLVLVTADSDLITTVETIMKDFPDKEIKLYFPPKRTSGELFNKVKKVVYLENNKSKFDAALMQDVVTAGAKTYTKPADWK